MPIEFPRRIYLVSDLISLFLDMLRRMDMLDSRETLVAQLCLAGNKTLRLLFFCELGEKDNINVFISIVIGGNFFFRNLLKCKLLNF